MSEKLIREYKLLDVKAIKPRLLVYGELGGQCKNCDEMDVKLSAQECPSCQAVFQYIAFRVIASHLPKIRKLMEERPDLHIIDFQDYQKNAGALNAEEFFK